MYLLHSRVQPYAWGSRTAIPEFLGVAPLGDPQAELWMGAHPQLPSEVDLDGRRVSLGALIAADPARVLGAGLVARFGPELPFLCKVLAADEPLSLQAHPSKAQAVEGHAREERAGLDARAANRSYRDRNHKPELLCALTPFEVLCGFRPRAEALDVLRAVAGPMLRHWVSALAATRSEDDLRLFLGQLLTLPRHEAAALVEELAGNAPSLGDRGDARLLQRLAAGHPSDAGVVVAALLQRIELSPGDALFLGPGTLHGYIEGVAVEVMAASDNVLRGGLTPKHVDVQELLRVLDVDDAPRAVLRPRADDSREAVYEAPAEEFRLSVLSLRGDDGAPAVLEPRGPSIVVCTAGSAVLSDGRHEERLGRGGSVFLPADHPVVHVTGSGTLHRVTVGDAAFG